MHPYMNNRHCERAARDQCHEWIDGHLGNVGGTKGSSRNERFMEKQAFPQTIVLIWAFSFPGKEKKYKK